MAQLTIQLLGNALIRTATGAPVVLRRRARLLLFYIAGHTDALSRERCMAVFWADEPPETARQSLRTALYQIKVACGPVILTDQQTLRLDAGVSVDTRQLLHTHAGDVLLDALQQQPAGVFCAELDTAGIDALQSWVDSERTRWQRRLADVLLQHSQWLVQNGRLLSAVQSITAALSYEPLREEASQYAMQLHMRANDRAAAIACYQTLFHALDDQLGVPPLAATTALYHDIVTDRFRAIDDTPRNLASEEPFIGRQAELTLLHGLAWDGRVVAVSGAPGIGKTRLTQEYLRRSNAVIVHAVAYAGDDVLPYHVLGRAMRALFHAPRWHGLRTHAVLPTVWQSELRRLWPELPGLDPEPLPFDGADSRLPEAIALLLQHIAQHQRIAVFIDDAQWIDDASARVFVALHRRSLVGNWLTIMTLRPGVTPIPITHLLLDAERRGLFTRVSLDALSTYESAQLARTYNPAIADDAVSRTEGNPFMLVAFARSDTSTPATLPEAIRALIASRLAVLRSDARRLVEAAAVAGREFDYRLCAQIAHLDEHTATEACDELVRHGIVRLLHGTQARFDHPLTVESILAAIGPATIHHLSRSFADFLAVQPLIDHARVANFYAAAGQIMTALPYADVAARDAQGLGAWNEAEHYMRLALRAVPASQSAHRLLALGDLLLWAGNEKAAAAALQSAIEHDEHADGEIADEARLVLARSYLPAARYDDAIALTEPLSAHRTPRIAMHAAFICGTAYSLAGVALNTAATFLSRAEVLCRHQDAQDVLPRILFEQGGIAAQQGDLPLAVERYREAVRAAEAQPAVTMHLWLILAHNNLGYHLLLQGNIGDASRHARIAMRISERVGLLRVQSYVLSTMGEIALARADTTTAERLFVEALACAERYGMPERIAGLHANLGLVARAREDIEEAVVSFERALLQADALGTHHLAAQIRIWLASVVNPARARVLLNDARVIAQSGDRVRLLAEIDRMMR
jgi:DNA-binding SARP family transcriptional activator